MRNALHLSTEICERARLSKDRRFDGQFFIGVRTTGIYCRPICPAPTAKSENVAYYASAAAAHEAGLRPCLRCRPEAAPGSPAWRGTEATVTRALRMIESGALDEGNVLELAARLGIGERHLRRLFVDHVGASPVAVAQTRRVHIAKTLLDETDLSMTAVAGAAGFGSVRHFNATIRDTYGQSPSALRRSRRAAIRPPNRPTAAKDTYVLRLPYRTPFDWRGLLAFFAQRATPGVEIVTADTYRRNFAIGDASGMLEVCAADATQARTDLVARVRCTDPRVLPAIVGRLRHQFDLGADPMAITAHLRRDPLLARCCEAASGIRVPGAFDGFEVAVRGILGQQVTVRGATTIAGRIVARCGARVSVGGTGDGDLGDFPEAASRNFPTPAELAAADLEEIGMPGARIEVVRALARAVRDGDVVLDGTADHVETLAKLQELPGIGEWTATYIAMRVLGDPDAFPSTDLGLRKALRPRGAVSAAELRDRAERWRPWRSYAAAILWRSLASREPATSIPEGTTR